MKIMKRTSRLFVAVMMAVVMSCTAFGVYATGSNTVEIVSIGTDLPIDVANLPTDVADADDWVVYTSDLVSITARLVDSSGNDADGKVTFMSYKYAEGKTVADVTEDEVSYIGQSDDSVTFRPRMTTNSGEALGAGVYVLMIGGTDVSTPLTYYYTVAEPAKEIVVSSIYNQVGHGGNVSNQSNDAKYSLDNFEGLGSGLSVAIDGTPLTVTTQYTVENQGSGWLLTILPAAYSSLGIGNHTVTVSYNNEAEYIPGTANLEIAPVVNVTYTNVEGDPSNTVAKTFLAQVDQEGNNITAEIDMKIHTSDKSSSMVASKDKYFKAWSENGNDHVIVRGGETTFTYTTTYNNEDVALNVEGKFYDAQDGTGADDLLSGAGYQKISYSGVQQINGEGVDGIFDAVRYIAILALPESSNNVQCGFVITNVASAPTKEAGYNSTTSSNLYKKILNAASNGYMQVSDKAGLHEHFATQAAENTAGFFYYAMPVRFNYGDGQTYGSKIDKQYSATPYVQYSVGGTNYTVYGESTGYISYSEIGE